MATFFSTKYCHLPAYSRFSQRRGLWLTSQLRRAGVSVASNIAEGYGRGSTGEYKQFLAMARGSNLEVQTQLLIAKELGFGTPEKFQTAEQFSQEVNKMLTAILNKL